MIWNKGRHLTEKHKANISAGQKGRIGGMMGKHHSEETKAKIGASNKGKHDMRGERNPFWGKRGDKAAFYGHHHTDEAKAKLRVTHLGKKRLCHFKHSEESKAKLSIMRMGKNNPQYGKHPSEETRVKLCAAHSGSKNGMFGRHHSVVARAKMSASRKGKHRSEEGIRKWMLAINVKPNGAEQKLIGILNNHWPSEWKYVGDGQVIFGGLNPDFINCNGKKLIIELFGDHWHQADLIVDKWRRSELGRMMVFSQFGYKMLVVWERELKNEAGVVDKIEQFSKVRR